MLFCLALVAGLMPKAQGQGPEISAASAIVMTGGGQVLFEKNADSKALVASTTKLMTALVIMDKCALSEPVKIPESCCGIEGSSMGLLPGSVYTVRELLLGMLLVSGNDAASALACHAAGSEKAFAAMMMRKAKSLGMDSSAFVNPHGLDAPGHYSTARDMAKLMIACMEDEDLAELLSLQNASVHGRKLKNHNKLLWELPGCTGGKTGYTRAAGRCLVSSCRRKELDCVCVTLGAPDDWRDHSRLYDWSYGECRTLDAWQGWSYELPVVSGDKDSVSLLPGEKKELYLPPGSKAEIRAEVPHFVFAPIEKGETGGRSWYIIDEKPVGECPLVYEDSVGPEPLPG